MIRKSALLASAALIAASASAVAQTVPPPSDESGKPTRVPATEGSSAQTAAVQTQALQQQPVDTGNIVITATRRNQALSDVPMAVSAVTAQTLRYTGANDIRQLNQVAPSLLVSSTSSESGAAVARIRGIGTVGDNPGLEGSVGVFIDGVYRSRTGMALTELGPLDRIEVLRGPQGTLFGRNTSAGLISIITAKPRFDPEVDAQVDIGNHNERRFEGSATGPLSDSIAVRLDGVYLKRDGFLTDVISGRKVDDRNRWMLRGQLLYQPNSDFSLRLIGDYSRQKEECCAAPYLPTQDVVANGSGGVTSQPSTIAAIERGLGGVIDDNTFARNVAITPGRDYSSRVNDGGISGEANYDMGWAQLTSITAYRYNKNAHGQDTDFNNLDLLYRASDGGSYNRFKTFSQELRLQGNAFNHRLDWLVGGYYANEKLTLSDNLAYGADYSRYGNCIVATSFAAAAPPILAPGASPTCFNTPVATAVRNALVRRYDAALVARDIPTATALGGQITALGAFAGLNNMGVAPGIPSVNFGAPPFGPSGFSNVGLLLTRQNLGLNGASLNDRWNQTNNTWALFTHNIISFSDQLKLTLGARFTHEQKRLVGNLSDDNVLCTAISSSPFIGLAQLPCVIPSAPGGTLNIAGKRTENKLSGTAVLSFRPIDSLLTYVSYSRGYKAGGFNLDRSALFRATASPGSPPISGFGAICVTAAQPNCQGVASAADLEFKPETNDAFEVGAKFHSRAIDLNLALFHQMFSNFQLNTFNGLNFIVENINSCSTGLNGADLDNDPRTGACTGRTRAGVVDTGFELEAFTRPIKDVLVNGGLTYSDARYRHNLVGANGAPLSNALFQLPGRQISNAPRWTITASAAWTPRLGNSGLRGLIYADMRHMSQFNTGSDLDVEKTQNAFTVVNARLGVHGPDDAWGIELWAQNLFNQNFYQVAFNSPVQGVPAGASTRAVEAGFYPRSTQLFNAFLGEPRTFGLTLRAKLGFHKAAPLPAPPPPPPPPAVTQTCTDGSVILATAVCPSPPPPPPPPPTPAPERGS